MALEVQRCNQLKKTLDHSADHKLVCDQRDKLRRNPFEGGAEVAKAMM